MKYLFALFLVVSLPSGCTDQPATGETHPAKDDPTFASPSSADYPVLVVDEAHSLASTNTPLVYKISPAMGLKLDTSKFHFTYGSNTVAPNNVGLVINKSVYDLTTQTETNLYLVDRSTLSATDHEIFWGFKSGDHTIISIGYSPKTKVRVNEELYVSWMAQIEVK